MVRGGVAGLSTRRGYGAARREGAGTGAQLPQAPTALGYHTQVSAQMANTTRNSRKAVIVPTRSGYVKHLIKLLKH